MTVVLKEVRENRKEVWDKFAPLHYDCGTEREGLANGARCFVAVEDGKVVGFAAVMNHFGHPGVWRSHKIVAVPPFRFADVCEAAARFVTGSGHRYHCITPVALAAYREGSPMWRKISDNGVLSSWEFLPDRPWQPAQWIEHWGGMPEFVSEDKKAFHTLRVVLTEQPQFDDSLR